MANDDMSEAVVSMRRSVINDVISIYIPPNSIDEQWNVPGLEQALRDLHRTRGGEAQLARCLLL